MTERLKYADPVYSNLQIYFELVLFLVDGAHCNKNRLVILPEQWVFYYRLSHVFRARWWILSFLLFFSVPRGKVVNVVKQSLAWWWSLKDSLGGKDKSRWGIRSLVFMGIHKQLNNKENVLRYNCIIYNFFLFWWMSKLLSDQHLVT